MFKYSKILLYNFVIILSPLSNNKSLPLGWTETCLNKSHITNKFCELNKSVHSFTASIIDLFISVTW